MSRKYELWKILVCYKKLLEIWQLSSQILPALILLKVKGLGWTSLGKISSQGMSGGWKRRVALLFSLMPQGGGGGGGVGVYVGGNGTALCKSEVFITSSCSQSQRELCCGLIKTLRMEK